MEFDKLSKSNNNSKLTSIEGGKGEFKTDPKTMGVQALLPQAKQMLEGLFAAYGLEYPDINMGDPKFKDKVVAVGKVAEVARINMTALNQMLKHTATLMQGQVKLAEFYAASTAIVVEGKKRIDRATADAFLNLADYNKQSKALKGKVNRKIQQLDAKYELMAELGEGKLQSSLKLIETQKQTGAKRIADTEATRESRQKLIDQTRVSRAKERNYIATGHLKGSSKK